MTTYATNVRLAESPYSLELDITGLTSVTLMWNHPTDTSVPRNYSVEVSKSGSKVSITNSTSANQLILDYLKLNLCIQRSPINL